MHKGCATFHQAGVQSHFALGTAEYLLNSACCHFLKNMYTLFFSNCVLTLQRAEWSHARFSQWLDDHPSEKDRLLLLR